MGNPAHGLAYVVALAAACGGSPRSTSRTVSPGGGPAASPDSAALASNVSRADYVGSTVCAGCHRDIAAAWARSPMHRMTRDAATAELRAPFDGTRWTFHDDVLITERRAGRPFIRIEPAQGAAQTFRVTRVIGGRTREDFAGVDVTTGAGGEEVVLPVSFVFGTRSLRYKGYSVMLHERTSLRAGPVWRETCLFCHNTVPEIDRLWSVLAGPHAPPYQGETVERWLPPANRATYEVHDAAAFARAALDEEERLGQAAETGPGTARQTARAAIDLVRARFGPEALVETGIGCEACHGGGRGHVERPEIPPSFVPSAPWLDVRLPRATRADAINRVCARCHQVLFSRYPFTWEGGRRDHDAGGSHVNSGEARDFLLGACSGRMACTTCHDPHRGSDRDALRRLATPAGNAVCTSCHAELAAPDRLRAHAHHDPAGAGGACVACHMPRKNMGLDGTLTRYHRIGSPTDPERVLGDRPLECALCHADRDVGSLADTMERWWPVRYPRARLVELYGGLDANVLRATLARGKPHERVVAMAVLGEDGARDAAPAVAAELLDEYPLVREWALRATRSLVGRCDVDLAANDDVIARQAGACVPTLRALSPIRVDPSPDEPAED